MRSEEAKPNIESIIAMLQTQGTQTQIQPQQQRKYAEENRPEAGASTISLEPRSVDQLLECIFSAHDRINKLIEEVKEST